MLDVMLTTSSNFQMSLVCYMLLSSLIPILPNHIVDYRMTKETYRTGDGVEVNHKELMKLSDDYKKYAKLMITLNPLTSFAVFFVMSGLFFGIPGYFIANLLDTATFIIPHFCLYIAFVFWTLLSKEYKEQRMSECAEFAKNVFISNKEIPPSKKEVHPVTIDSEKNEREVETSQASRIPHSVSVIQDIAADNSLPSDIRYEAKEALREYEKRRELEKEKARVEDARISLDVAKKMLE